MRGEEVPTLTCNPHCSMGTYLFIDDKTKTAVPITRFIDVGGMLQDMDEFSRSTRRSILQIFTKVKAWRSLRRNFKPQFAPPGLTFERFLQTLQGMTDKKLGRDGMDGRYTYRTLLFFWKDVQAKNWVEVDRRVADTFAGTGPGGIMDRAAFLRDLQRAPLADYALSECSSQLNGGDMVVTCTLRANWAGQRSQASTLSVWQQLKKG